MALRHVRRAAFGSGRRCSAMLAADFSSAASPSPPTNNKDGDHERQFSTSAASSSAAATSPASSVRGAATATSTAAAAAIAPAATFVGPAGFLARSAKTAEVVVSKIFLAGFGWQGMSVAAGLVGHGSDTLQFALYTGAGDMAGVAVGHTLWFAAKKAVTGDDINIADEAQTGLLLGCAAFCSGTAWQPALNFFHNTANLGFVESASGVGLVCTAAFFAGLRLARPVLSKFCPAIADSDYANLQADAALSASVGGASFGFVGTDLSFVPEGTNFLAPLVGVAPSHTVLQGMCLAGASTGLGFAAVQTLQNAAGPRGRNWLE